MKLMAFCKLAHDLFEVVEYFLCLMSLHIIPLLIGEPSCESPPTRLRIPLSSQVTVSLSIFENLLPNINQMLSKYQSTIAPLPMILFSFLLVYIAERLNGISEFGHLL